MKLVLKSDHSIEVSRTLEVIHGASGFLDPKRDADGGLDFDWDTNGTDVDWDSQRTVKRDGQRVFLTEDGEEVLESELELVDDDDDGEGP